MVSCVVRCDSFEHVDWVTSNGVIIHPSSDHSPQFQFQRGECNTTTNTQTYTLYVNVTTSTLPIVKSVVCKGVYLATEACYSAVVDVSLQTSNQDQTLSVVPEIKMINNVINQTIELICTVPRRIFSSVTWIRGNTTWDAVRRINKPSDFQSRFLFSSDKDRSCVSLNRHTTYTLLINVSDSTTLEILPSISCAGYLESKSIFSRLIQLTDTLPTMSTTVFPTRE